jgi:hypothetical protein
MTRLIAGLAVLLLAAGCDTPTAVERHIDGVLPGVYHLREREGGFGTLRAQSLRFVAPPDYSGQGVTRSSYRQLSGGLDVQHDQGVWTLNGADLTLTFSDSGETIRCTWIDPEIRCEGDRYDQ